MYNTSLVEGTKSVIQVGRTCVHFSPVYGTVFESVASSMLDMAWVSISNMKTSSGGAALSIAGNATVTLFKVHTFPVCAFPDQLLSCLIVLQCEFVGNRATKSGGAVSSVNAAMLTVSDCIFSYRDNEARCIAGQFDGCNGGAISIYVADQSVLHAQATISDCTFTSNRAQKQGGVVRSENVCSLIISVCAFFSNSA